MALSKKFGISDDFSELIDECSVLVDASVTAETADLPQVVEPLPSLLEQIKGVTSVASSTPEPLRSIHHFACTGGTLIAKCIVTMPNIFLLSEIAPHSRLGRSKNNRFMPTDLIQMIRDNARGPNTELESKVFLAGLRELHGDCESKGLRLVLRDHPHSKYCTDGPANDAPHLGQLLWENFPTRSVVTVRHPLDSFLSLQVNGWTHFTPDTIDEYARRYQRFLDDHDELRRFRYEDFIKAPELVTEEICVELDIPFVEDFEPLIAAQQLSGDSGRSGSKISNRSRREIPASVSEQLEVSGEYRELCSRLGYDWRPDISD